MPQNFFPRWMVCSFCMFLFFTVSIFLILGISVQFEINSSSGDLWETAIIMSLFVGFFIAKNYEPSKPKEKTEFWKQHDEYQERKRETSRLEDKVNDKALIDKFIEEAPDTHNVLIHFIPHMDKHYRTLKGLGSATEEEQSIVREEFFRLFNLFIKSIHDDGLIKKNINRIELNHLMIKCVSRFSEAYPKWDKGYLYAHQYLNALIDDEPEKEKQAEANSPKTQSKTKTKITVNTNEFLAAVSQLPTMQRAPSGAKGKIPKDTILTPTEKGISVDTPMIKTLVTGKGSLNESISVNASELLGVVRKNAGKKGKSIKGETIDLWVENDALQVKGYFLTSIDRYN